MDIIINTKQLNSLKSSYKTKYVDNSDLYKSPKLCKGVNQKLNNLKIIDIIEQYGELVNEYPNILKREMPIGECEDGSPIQLYILNKTKTEKPIILIVGGVHGDEKTSVFGIYKTVKFLLSSNKWSRFITSNFVVHIIPCLNVYGFNNNKRNNSNNKDLNRDFINQTQKETKALTSYINKNKDRIKIILDSHNAYNEEFVSCKQEMKYFEEYEDVAFKLNLFLNGKYESDYKKTFLWISKSKNDGTLSDFINKNKFIGHTVESPRSLIKEIHYPNPMNYEDGAEVTIDLLVNLMYIYGKMFNDKTMNETSNRDFCENLNIIQDTADVLMEERGINNAVKRETSNISYIIDKKLKEIDLEYDVDLKLYYKTCSFYKNIFGVNFKIDTFILFFDSYDESKNFTSLYNSECSIKDKKIKIVASSIHGQISNSYFEGTIQHELTHLLQFLSRSHNSIFENDETLYNKSVEMSINNKGFAKFLGNAIYMSFKVEEEAYGNDLYVQLKNTTHKNWRDAYSSTLMYKTIKNMQEVLKCLKNPNKTLIVNKVLTEYNLNKKDIIKRIESSIHRCIKRAGKIISLVNDEYKLFEFHIMDGINLMNDEDFNENDVPNNIY